MPKIEIYASRYCPYCMWARQLLNAKGVDYQVHDVDADAALWREMEQRTGGHTVPQIIINDRPVGGYDDLSALDRRRGLDPLLAEDPAASTGAA
jgi:glutaredoxin 3